MNNTYDSKTKCVWLIIGCLFVLINTAKADKPTDANSLDIDQCRAVVDGIYKLHQRANEQFKTGHFDSILDPQEYFSVCRHLLPPEGYVLDSVYGPIGHDDQPLSDGQPLLYFRKQQGPPFASFEEYDNATGLTSLYKEKKYKQARIKINEYRTLIRTDGSAQGFFELAVYSTLAGQYALEWHSNYFDTQVLVDKKAMQKVCSNTGKNFGMAITEEQKKEAEKIDPTPTVKINEDMAEVSLVLFSKWGGFFRRTFTYQESHPHKVQTKDETLVEYDCGVLF